MKLLEDHDAALRAEIQRLRGVCYEAYQFASCVGAPTRILDNLSDASRGEPLRHETILPVSAEECDEIQRLTTDETEWIRLKLELDATIQRLTTELSALRTRLEAHERVMEQYWSHPMNRGENTAEMQEVLDELVAIDAAMATEQPSGNTGELETPKCATCGGKGRIMKTVSMHSDAYADYAQLKFIDCPGCVKTPAVDAQEGTDAE